MNHLISIRGVKVGFFCFFTLLTLYAEAQLLTGSESKGSDLVSVQILLSGHRGGFDCQLPENSVSLFNYTLKNSCSLPVCLEFDIRKSKNGTLFLMHDSTVNRTTTGSGKITELEDSYLKSLYLLDRNGNVTNEKIPLFIDILSGFKNQDVIFMLDGKGHVYTEIIEMVKMMNLADKCIFLTFNETDTRIVNNSGIKSAISVLAGNELEWKTNLEMVKNSTNVIAYINDKTSQELSAVIKKAGARIMTDVNEMARNNGKVYSPEYYQGIYLSKTPDILITDFPATVSQIFCK